MAEKKLLNLDDPQIYQQYDTQSMLTHIHNFPRMCQQSWQMAMDFELPSDFGRVNKVVVLGMGGSAIGGDLVSSIAAPESTVPILVCRDYSLPAYVDENTLVIASSYSGNTEETLSAFEQALKIPARTMAITTGGRLKALCEGAKVPLLRFNYRGQPRATLPFSFLIILGLLQRLDFIKDKYGDVSETIFKLEDMCLKTNQKVPESQNPAKSLAKKLYGRLGIVYGAGITTEVAHRWKTQINENSKAMAFYEFFSELNHNSVVGYPLPEELTRRTFVVLLNSNLLHERVRLRYEITQKLLEQAGIYYQAINGEGDSALSQIMGLILLGDYVSYYLAMLNQVDPTPVTAIDFLKDSLAKSSFGE